MSKIIRSFSRREGRMTSGQLRAFTELWSVYGLELATGLINFAAVFGRKAPVILEIGFGMGQSLLTMAANNPAQDYIGIEVHRPGIGALFAGLSEYKLTNVRVYYADAVEVLQNCIPDNSLAKILLFFPDPWPKRRHHKRRLIQLPFVNLLYSKLKIVGVLHMATDWEDYAIHMQKILANIKDFCSITDISRPLTKFELKGKQAGHKIWDLAYKKT